MLKLTKNDKEYLENLYEDFLFNLKYLFEKNNIKNAIDCYKILSNMLRKGLFSNEGTINFDTNFNYLSLPNMDYIGIQVMYGVFMLMHLLMILCHY